MQGSLRKPPHAFNLIRQIEVLQKSGHGGATQQLADPRRHCSQMFFFETGFISVRARVQNLSKTHRDGKQFFWITSFN